MNPSEVQLASEEQMVTEELVVEGQWTVEVVGHYEGEPVELIHTEESPLDEAYRLVENNSQLSVSGPDKHPDLLEFQAPTTDTLAEISDQKLILFLTRPAKPMTTAKVKALQGVVGHANNYEAKARLN